MAIERVDEFLTVLRRSQILASEQIAEVERELVPHYADAVSLGSYLVEIDWLTAYQLQHLLVDQIDELSYQGYFLLDQLTSDEALSVFKAWDSRKGRHVALKQLPDVLSPVAYPASGWMALTQLSDPSHVKTHEIFTDRNRTFQVMELLEGVRLDRFIQKTGPLSLELACELMRQVVHGLQSAHQLGLYHSQLGPDNLFLINPPFPPQPGLPPRRVTGPPPTLKVLGWSQTRTQRGSETTPPPSAQARDWIEWNALRRADFIAPETIGKPGGGDIRSDIYTLGCSLFYMIIGKSPFPPGDPKQKYKHQRETPTPLLRELRPEVPEELESLVLQMTAKNPLERPQIPLTLVTTLRRLGAIFGGGLGTPSSLLGGRPSIHGGPQRVGPAPGTALNLPRPDTRPAINRPGSQPNLPKPNEGPR